MLRLSLIINLLDLVSGSGSQGRPWVSVKMELSSINMQKKKNKASISHLDRTSLVETDVKKYTIFMRGQQRAIPSGPRNLGTSQPWPARIANQSAFTNVYERVVDQRRRQDGRTLANCTFIDREGMEVY